MSTALSTPTPWVVESTALHHYIRTEGGREVAAVVRSCMYPDPNALADARRIVQCVNNFDALVAALEYMVVWNGRRSGTGNDELLPPHKQPVDVRKAMDALSRATPADQVEA